MDCLGGAFMMGPHFLVEYLSSQMLTFSPFGMNVIYSCTSKDKLLNTNFFIENEDIYV